MNNSDRDKIIIETANNVKWIKAWTVEHKFEAFISIHISPVFKIEGREAGFEPAVPGFTVQCFNRLSYSRHQSHPSFY